MTRAFFLVVALLLASWAQVETRPPIQPINKIHSEGTKELLAVCSPGWDKCRPTEAPGCAYWTRSRRGSSRGIGSIGSKR